MKIKSIFYRILLVIILVIICFVMIYIGRGHTLYFDNKSMEVNGVNIEAPYKVKVFLNGKETADLSSGDRGMGIWIGPKAHFELEVTKTKGGTKESISYNLPLPREHDGVVINLVGLMNNANYDEYVSEFIPLATTVSESEDEVVIDEMEGLGFGE